MATPMAEAPENEQKNIAARLKEAREYLGISQQHVAEILSIPRSAVSAMENGQRGIDSVELKSLAKLYQRPIGYFTGDEQVAMGAEVALLAKQVAKLSEQDKSELMRFTEFLLQRSRSGGRDDNPT